jgi:hypothetical protein
MILFIASVEHSYCVGRMGLQGRQFLDNEQRDYEGVQRKFENHDTEPLQAFGSRRDANNNYLPIVN